MSTTKSKNEITGDSLVSKATTDAFRSGYDLIQWTTEEEEAFNDLSKQAEVSPSDSGTSSESR